MPISDAFCALDGESLDYDALDLLAQTSTFVIEVPVRFLVRDRRLIDAPRCTCSSILPWNLDYCPRHG